MRLKSDVLYDLEKVSTVYNLDAFQELGIAESLFLIWLYDVCKQNPKLNIVHYKVAKIIGIPPIHISRIIQNIQKLDIGSFVDYVFSHDFSPIPEKFEKVMAKLRSQKNGKKIIFLKDVLYNVTYKDLYNIGVLLGLMLEKNIQYDSFDDYELDINPEWNSYFYPDLNSFTDSFRDLRSMGYDFFQFGIDGSVPGLRKFIYVKFDNLEKIFYK